MMGASAQAPCLYELCYRAFFKSLTLCFLTLGLGFGYPGASYASAIKTVTLGPIVATRGDVITLSVEVTDPASEIQWWSDSRIICEKSTCQIDTGQYAPGEYSYHVVVKNKEELEIAEISISATTPPPLYRARKINSPPAGPNHKSDPVKNGQWLIIPRDGFVSFKTRSSSKKLSVLSFADKALVGSYYKVSRGGSVILRRIGTGEEWIIRANSTFRVEEEGVSLVSGEGVWRALPDNFRVQRRAKIFGLKVRGADRQILVATAVHGDKSATSGEIKLVEGTEVSVVCPGDRELILTERWRLNVDDSINCKNALEEPWRDLELKLMKVFPWWFESGDLVNEDHWRVEADYFRLFYVGDKLTERNIVDAFDQRRCSEVLDLSSRLTDPASDLEILRARCQLTLGLQNEALKNFNSIESRHLSPALTAFFLAKTYHELRQLPQALDWYKEALSRGYEDKSGLARSASIAARDAGLSREQLGWLDAIVLTERDQDKLPAAVEDASRWRENRPIGAALEVGGFVDSQVVPVNSKKISSMPRQAKASRGFIAVFKGDWWSSWFVAKNAFLRLDGKHYFKLPSGAGQEPFGIIRHDVKAGIVVDERATNPNEAERNPRGWMLHPALVLGTGSLGLLRERDRMGWELNISRYDEWTYFLSIHSDKYLDPAPAGQEEVDIDLFRLTGPGDFSRFEGVLRGGVQVRNGNLTFTPSFEYGQVDYRTSTFDFLDHDIIRINMQANYRLLPMMGFEFLPAYTSRYFGNSRAKENIVELGVAMTWRPKALWHGKLTVGLENRGVSDDPVSSWTRSVYGVSTTADF